MRKKQKQQKPTKTFRSVGLVPRELAARLSKQVSDRGFIKQRAVTAAMQLWVRLSVEDQARLIAGIKAPVESVIPPAQDQDGNIVSELSLPDSGFSLDRYLDSVQKQYIELALKKANGVKREAARLLGIACTATLAGQMKRLYVECKTDDGDADDDDSGGQQP